MCTGSDTEGPITPEPSSRTLVSRGGAHDARQQGTSWIERTHGERVDRLGEPRLGEGPKIGGRGHLGELNDRAPELANETERDLVLLTHSEKDPATLVERDGREIAEPEVLGLVWR